MSVSGWIWPLVVSPFIGSFLGVLVTRADAPRTILWTRSVCDSCGHTLRPADLVPLASWATSGGRCRYCHTRVGWFYPAIELAAVAVAAWAAMLATGWLLWVSCAFGWALLALAAIDWRDYRLPDFLTLPLIPAGLEVHYLLLPSAPLSLWPESLLSSTIGAVAGYMFVLFVRWAYNLIRRREGIGLGDAKLFAAAGAWVGWAGLPSVLLVAAVSGLAAALLRYRGKATLRSDDPVPFGTFLCLGIWIIWLYGPLA
jgi:leader peptidase (prepilin peptidase)/N-methyltransferase